MALLCRSWSDLCLDVLMGHFSCGVLPDVLMGHGFFGRSGVSGNTGNTNRADTTSRGGGGYSSQPIRKRWHFPQSFILSIICLLVVAGGLFWGTVGRADPYHHLAEPLFFDPLDNSQTDNYWFTGDFGQNSQQQKNNCDFHEQNYVVTAGYSDNNTNIAWCTATATNFDNFVYEVQMNITIIGSCGGIVFRADLAHSKYYLFELCSGQPTPNNPSYKLVRYDNTSTQSGYTLIDNPNVNQSFVSNRFYTVAVVARGINFEMYVDHQMINTAFDTSSNALTQGQIGVAAIPNTSNSAQVDFRNAQVWAF